MWLFTRLGFFSIVEKPEDRGEDRLTVRARVRADLAALRGRYLPELGPVSDRGGDYRYHAKAPRRAVARALAAAAADIDYANFKNEVARAQGPVRHDLYARVWDVMYELQQPTHPAARPPRPRPRRRVIRGER